MAAFDGISDLLSQTFADLGLSVSVTLTRASVGAYSPSTGQRPITTTTETVGAVVDTLRRELVEGVAIQAGDLRIIVPADDLTAAPSTKDTITYAGQEFAILAVVPVVAGALVITYEIHARAS